MAYTCFCMFEGSGVLNQERFVCKCSMNTSHPPSAMVLEYGRIPCVYGRIPTVYGRIPPVYGRIPRVYGRIPAHPF